MTMDYHIAKCPPILQRDKVKPGAIELKEERNPLGCQEETTYPKKISAIAPDNKSRGSTGIGEEKDHLKMASERSLSVFDLLGDDEPNDNLERSPTYEAHVAFAVEGLGRVEAETPVHSPAGRGFSHASSSPFNAARKLQISKNLNLVYDIGLEVGAASPDMSLPFSGSFLELPFSGGISNSLSKPRQKLSTSRECLLFNSNASKLKKAFVDEETFCNIENENDDIWNDSNFPALGHDMKWKNRSLNVDSNFADYWNLENCELSNFVHEGPCLQQIRVTEKAENRFKVSGSPSPYSKQVRPKNDYDFVNPDGSLDPVEGGNLDFVSGAPKRAWSCYVTEDAGESLSMLSEESCSSRAVRGKATARSPSHSMARQNRRKYGRDIRSPVNQCNFGEIEAEDGNFIKLDVHKQKNMNGLGKFTKVCSPSHSKPANFSNPIFLEKFQPEDRDPFEQEYMPVDRQSEFSSFNQTSGEKRGASSGPALWTEDPFDTYPFSELHPNVKSSFDRSKHDILSNFVPPGSFPSEKLAFCEPSTHSQSYNSAISSANGPLPCKSNFCMDCKLGSRPQDLFPITGLRGDAESLHESLEECVAKDRENGVEIQPSDYTKFQVQKDVCKGSNDLSSENDQSLEASGLKDNCSGCKEVRDSTSEIEDQKVRGFLEHAEEIVSSLKVPEKCEHSTDGKEYHNDVKTANPHQRRCTGSTEVKDSEVEESTLESKGQNASLDQSYQVMMLESYVLQLLCVQKVLKEASVQGTAKRV